MQPLVKQVLRLRKKPKQSPCNEQVASALEKLLSAPALLIPMGQASDACHLANERLRCQNLLHGKNVIKSFIKELASELPTCK